MSYQVGPASSTKIAQCGLTSFRGSTVVSSSHRLVMLVVQPLPELKDQKTGGHGSYLRHGIAQAVLYRHYIHSVSALDPWLRKFGLERTQCRAALAFPTAAPSVRKIIDSHRDLAKRFDVDVIEFERPGKG